MDVFLNLPEFKIQNQILHHLLFHEIYQADQNEMRFKFRESNVRFSVVEIYQANQNEMWFKFREFNVRFSVVEFCINYGS